jgi:uncharacterized membrane protein YqaE (UPF0057 family)
MDINFPRHKKLIKSLLLFLLPPIFVLVAFLFLGASVWLAILLSILTLAISFYFTVARHRIKHSKFLDSFGTPVKNSVFYQKEYAIGAVPFSSKFMSCCARIENSNLFFGRSRHYRILDLSQLENIEILNCLGHEVAKLEVKENSQEEPLFIPWSPLLANEVEFENGI